MADNKVQIFGAGEGYNTTNITATGAWLSWGAAGQGTEQLPLLMSQINMTYSRSIQPIYPVNSGTDGLVKLQILGAPQGQLQCTGIITPTQELLTDFLTKTGVSCKSENIVMEFQPFNSHIGAGICKSQFGYRMTGLTLQTVGFSVQGNEVAIISQPLAFTFTSLELYTPSKKANTPQIGSLNTPLNQRG